jgi:UDP-N-acetyl-D-mannosaminuronic acid dehydrogenase
MKNIYIVGMGYVGTSLSAVIADAGHSVTGVDIDTKLVETINQGECPIEEGTITDRFEEYAKSGRITASTSYEGVADADTVIITVGTPLEGANPDLTAVNAATEAIGNHLTPDTLVIFRSTLPAGATENELRIILNNVSGLKAGEEYSLAFCPERMAEGSAYKDLTTLPVVVGGFSDACQKKIETFWNEMGQDTVAVSSPTAAELTKLADNWWIDLNIALANELALLSEQLGVDALEVIHAANTLPKGEHNVNILFPGSGVGGSCLVKDPWFVADLGEVHGLDLETPRVSREVNDQMPGHVVGLADGALDGLENERIAVLGYAFKGGTDDTRNTPAKPIVERLRAHGADIRVTDPHVPDERIKDELEINPVELTVALENADAVILVTGHERYKDISPDLLIDNVGSQSFVVVDGRHVFDPDDFAGTAVDYRGVGRGTNE